MGDKHGFNKDDIKKGLILAGSLCIVVVFYLLIGKIGALFALLGKLVKAMSSVIIGCVIAFLLNPVMNLLQRGFLKLYKKAFKNASEKKIYRMAKVTAVTFTILFCFAGAYFQVQAHDNAENHKIDVGGLQQGNEDRCEQQDRLHG